MDSTTWGILFVSVALASSGQLLLKVGMSGAGTVVDLRPKTLLQLVGTVLASWKLLLGLACFGLSALLWLVTLSRVPLSTPTPS